MAVRDDGDGRHLAALARSAHALTGPRDVHSALRSVLRHAREATGADLCLLDVAVDVVGGPMVDGTVSAHFHSDRPTQPEAALRREGMAEVISARVALNDRIVGTLAAGRRPGHPFSERDGHLLAALAGHAAIALDVAALIEDARMVLTDLHHATEAAEARARDLADAEARHATERAALLSAAAGMAARVVAAGNRERATELLGDLVTGTRDDTLVERARAAGVDLARPHTVLVAVSDGTPRSRLAEAAERLTVLARPHLDHVVALAPAPSPARVAAELTAAVGALVTVGASDPVTGTSAIRAAHSEALRCARALVALGRAGDGGRAAELGLVGLLLGAPGGVPGYVRRIIGPVLDYDAKRGTSLHRTLVAYFAAGGNLTRTKTALNVHVNTVVQRLERISSLLGPDWQAPERALEVHTALRLHDLTKTTGSWAGIRV